MKKILTLIIVVLFCNCIYAQQFGDKIFNYILTKDKFDDIQSKKVEKTIIVMNLEDSTIIFENKKNKIIYHIFYYNSLINIKYGNVYPVYLINGIYGIEYDCLCYTDEDYEWFKTELYKEINLKDTIWNYMQSHYKDYGLTNQDMISVDSIFNNDILWPKIEKICILGIMAQSGNMYTITYRAISEYDDLIKFEYNNDLFWIKDSDDNRIIYRHDDIN